MSDNKMSKVLADELIKLIILEQKYLPKEKLPNEREICSMFGVSRQVVREALKTLEAQGYLFTMHGSGSYVAENPGVLDNPFSIIYENIEDKIALLSDWYCTRRAIESEVISLAVRNATAKDIKEIEAKHLLLKQKDDDNIDEFLYADRDFHLQIAKASHNIILEKCTLHLLQSFYYDLVNSAEYIISNTLKRESELHHERIVEFIKARDEEGAVMSIRSHMNHALRIINADYKALIED